MVTEIHPWIPNTPESRIWRICTDKMSKHEAESHLKDQIIRTNKPISFSEMNSGLEEPFDDI